MAFKELDAFRARLREEVNAGEISLEAAFARIQSEATAATINALGHGKRTLVRELVKRPWTWLGIAFGLGLATGLLTHIWF